MTATVVSLASHRRNHRPTTTCRACRPDQGFTCHPHRIAQLAARIREQVELLDPDALLVDREWVERIVADMLATADEVTHDFLPDERTAR
jgi:hypothetical protein